MHIKVGTRGSKLALIQTQSVIDVLEKAFPEHSFECVIIHTKGDKNVSSLSKIGGDGLFIREIEEQLIQDNIQMAIHSMKDCPIELRKGLTLSKAWKREDNHDVCILNQTTWNNLKPHAKIATGSIRRKKQLETLRNDIEIIDIRGNIDTRIRKMKENGYDGLILAKAGLNRLSIPCDYIFSYEEMCPSPCQGALAIECKEDNVELLQMLDTFYDEKTEIEVCCERSFLKEMKCSCQNPIGASATYENGNIHLYAMYGDEKLYYASVDGNHPEQVAFEAAKRIRKQMKHHVTLVSAGPGNIKDVTLAAFEAVAQGDCILYDRLIPMELLDYAQKECECIYVGKASHHHTMTQDEINALLVEKSLQYKHVVRLKGGDVFVLARGQEEIQTLKDKGISYSTISGVSSCIAAPGSAGIPLTMRNISTGFHVMSAHNTKGEFSHLDFKSLAKSQDTLVFLMGLSKAKKIAQKLMDEGMEADMPMALISQATTMYQKMLYTTLEQIQYQKMDLKSPCMIVIGQCVQFHDENKKEIILPKIGKESISLDLPGYKIHEIQVSNIHFLPFEFKNIPNTIIFSSKHAIDSFFKQINDIRNFVNTKFLCVGASSANYLKSYGISCDFMPSIYNMETLIKECPFSLKNAVYLSGSNKREYEFESIKVYENKEIKIKNMNVYHPVLFTCGSNVNRFLSHVMNMDEFKEKGVAYSIGPKTSKVLKEWGIQNIKEAKEASLISLCELVKENED